MHNMIKSMTGFGRAEYADRNRKFTVEIKSVNHRYLDMTIKMPKKLNFFEAAIRNELKNYIQRGSITTLAPISATATRLARATIWLASSRRRMR